MTKKQIYHIIEWAIAAAACGYLVYRLVVFDDYTSVWTALRTMSAWQWGALALCVALMPINMSIEAWRWKTLIPLSISEAHRQVYYSKLAGLITPWRLGEYPARAILMAKGERGEVNDVWAKVLSMGAVGSVTMTAAIVIAGILSIIGIIELDSIEILDKLGWAYYALVGGMFFLLAVALYFAPRFLQRWAVVSHRLVAISLGQSFIRLLCWCVQLYFVLFALGAVDPSILGTFIPLLFIYYLLITITPNVPIAEAGVRGAWSIVLFGTPNAALAGVLLWGINSLLPCLVWPFLSKKNSCSFEDTDIFKENPTTTFL